MPENAPALLPSRLRAHEEPPSDSIGTVPAVTPQRPPARGLSVISSGVPPTFDFSPSKRPRIPSGNLLNQKVARQRTSQLNFASILAPPQQNLAQDSLAPQTVEQALVQIASYLGYKGKFQRVHQVTH